MCPTVKRKRTVTCELTAPQSCDACVINTLKERESSRGPQQFHERRAHYHHGTRNRARQQRLPTTRSGVFECLSARGQARLRLPCSSHGAVLTYGGDFWSSFGLSDVRRHATAVLCHGTARKHMNLRCPRQYPEGTRDVSQSLRSQAQPAVIMQYGPRADRIHAVCLTQTSDQFLDIFHLPRPLFLVTTVTAVD